MSWRSAFQPRRSSTARLLVAWGALSLAMLSAQSTGASTSAILAALRSGQNRQALQLCDRRVQKNRKDAQAWMLRGLALSGLHRSRQSLQSFQQALRLQPDSLPALEGAAQVAYQSGDAQAEPLLRRLARLQPDNATAQAMLATLAFQKGDCPQALAYFQRSGPALQQAPASLAQFGDCLIRGGQAQSAEQVFQRWLTLQPESHAARFDLGLSQYLNHQDQQAVTTLTPLLQASPSNPDEIKTRVNVLNLLAAAEEADHQTASAVAHLHEAIELAPRDPRNYLDLATISLVHRSYQVGIDVLNAGLRALPGNTSLAVARGVLYAQMGHFEQAEADFQHAETSGRNADTQRSTQRSAAAVGMGIALMQTDHIDGAIALLHQKLTQEPGNPDLNFLLAIALQRKGMMPGSATFQQAESALQQALQKRPSFAAARDELSALELRAKEPKKAAEDARLAMQLEPQNPSPVYHRMMALRQLGQTAEAARLARQLATLQADAQKRELAVNRVRLVETPSQN